jgi:hypothetical protein
MDLPLRSL